MTRDQAKTLLPIIEAWSRGETIQWRRNDGVVVTAWIDCALSNTDFDQLGEYRIKPKAREWWLVETYAIAGQHTKAFKTKADALFLCSSEYTPIHVREVIDE